MQVKTEGYDGNDNQEVESASQWNFSGALLYSVTIIVMIVVLLSDVLDYPKVIRADEGKNSMHVMHLMHEIDLLLN